MDNAAALLDLSWSVQPREGRAFAAVFRWNGKQVAVSTGEKTEAKAKEAASKVIFRWFKDQGEKAPTVKSETFADASRGFLEAKYLSRKASTGHEVETILRRLAALLPEDWGKLTRKTFKPVIPKLKGGSQAEVLEKHPDHNPQVLALGGGTQWLAGARAEHRR